MLTPGFGPPYGVLRMVTALADSDKPGKTSNNLQSKIVRRDAAGRVSLLSNTRNGPLLPANGPFSLVLFLTCFLAAALASQRFFYALSLAGLQVKRVTLYFLDDVLGLHLPLESPQGVFEGFPLLQSNFRQRATPPHSSKVDSLVMASNVPLSQVECAEILASPQKFNRIDSCNCRGANEVVGFIKLVGC